MSDFIFDSFINSCAHIFWVSGAHFPTSGDKIFKKIFSVVNLTQNIINRTKYSSTIWECAVSLFSDLDLFSNFFSAQIGGSSNKGQWKSTFGKFLKSRHWWFKTNLREKYWKKLKKNEFPPTQIHRIFPIWRECQITQITIFKEILIKIF